VNPDDARAAGGDSRAVADVSAIAGDKPVRAGGGRPRAIVLVHNPLAPYSRALRLARSLEDDGWEVVLAGLARPDLPVEQFDGTIRILRAAPGGPLARYVSPPGGWQARLLSRSDRLACRAGAILARIPGLDVLRSARTPTPRRILGVLRWPLPARAWSVGLQGRLPPADLYHACGIAALVAAEELAADARRHGRQGRVVYDVIDIFLEGNRYARLPAPLKRYYGRREEQLVGRSDAIVTVNEVIAEELRRRWDLGVTPIVVRNCPPFVPPPDPRPGFLRQATGLPDAIRLVLFLGILGPDRGLLESGEAVLRVPEAAFVALGFGPWYERLRARDRDPRFRGHHVTLPPVHPDDVPRWAAGADAVLIAVPGDSLNQRLSTPNKFWEGLAAGVPLVVGRDLEVMRSIVEEHDLGAVADPGDAEDLAAALRSVLDAPGGQAMARRSRAEALARERFNWDAQVGDYLALVDRLVLRLPGSREAMR
jgi:glycosyltransferase involved in cell wall biosynthesis